ncbi:MAG: 4-hydroxythreonine-4-phosphate dehydrogenase PdxA [Candidatus Omnitrophica bacterium]|jgi:4-hydroxythreonine-4-phosphate dehydrogenase|nr:4-hydroxythreonine-4-phosphate dehydrogenase PdxA [Candidatus Omnitrophota bacterium]
MKNFIGITIGDPSGIGPEVSIKAVLFFLKQTHNFYPVLIGDIAVLKRNLDMIKGKYILEKWNTNIIPHKESIYYLSPGIIKSDKFIIGQDNPLSGTASYEYFKLGWDLLKKNKITGLMTAPISKTAWQMAGINFKGHTDALKTFSGQDVEMLMVAGEIRVLLVSTHVPLKKIWDVISIDRIYNSTIKTVQFLRKVFIIGKENVGMCGLNPHAGESGYLGSEENEILIPAINKLKENGVNIEGPFPSDAIFRKSIQDKHFDLIVALYHDQALIPLKTFFFNKLVNVSANLNWCRTSPGHGTGYDIAYQNKANPSSTIEAIKLVVKISKKINDR